MPNITPLLQAEHANLKVQARTRFDEFLNVSALPVYAFEAATIARTHPLVFTKSEESFSLVLPCSLSEELPSAWVSREGKWLADYVPAVIRQRPFSILPRNEDKNRGVLCIDEDSDLLGDEGDALFNQDGSMTEFLRTKSELLKFFFQNGARTQTISSTLQEFDLIIPWEFQVAEPGATPRDVGGIYRIDEERLNGLSDEKWLELKNQGAMGMIYAQLLSTGHLKNMLQGLMDRVYIDRMIPDTESSIEGLFGEESETLDFDNL